MLIRVACLQKVQSDIHQVECDHPEHKSLLWLPPITVHENLEKYVLKFVPVIIILSIDVPDDPTIELVRKIKLISPDIECMIIATQSDETSFLRVMRAGASGYLLRKFATPERIITSIKQLARGESPLCPILTRILARHLSQETLQLNLEHNLTSKELEILELLAKGLSADDISDALSIQTSTVYTHSKKIYKKLEVNSRSEAVFEALALGII